MLLVGALDSCTTRSMYNSVQSFIASYGPRDFTFIFKPHPNASLSWLLSQEYQSNLIQINAADSFPTLLGQASLAIVAQASSATVDCLLAEVPFYLFHLPNTPYLNPLPCESTYHGNDPADFLIGDYPPIDPSIFNPNGKSAIISDALISWSQLLTVSLLENNTYANR